METEEKRLPIEDATGLQIERVMDIPKVTSDNDFDTAYLHGLKSNGADLYGEDTAIVKDGDKFLIGKKTGTNFESYMQIDSLKLLKDFIGYATKNFYRGMFTNIHDNFKINISTGQKTWNDNGIERKQDIITVVFKEELNNLKENISIENVISLTQALIGPIPPQGLKYWENGAEKTTNRAEYDILNDEIARKRALGPKDDKIYQKNLAIFKRFIDEKRESVISIQDDAKRERDGKGLPQNTQENLENWRNKLAYIHGEFTQMDRNIHNEDIMNKPFDPTAYNLDVPVVSSEDIKKLQKLIGAQDIETRKINEGEFNTALLKLDTDDRQEFRTYLNEVIAGRKDPNKEPFSPKKEEAFRALCGEYPWVEGYIKFEKTPNNGNGNGNGNGNNIYNGQTGNNEETLNTQQTDPTYAGFKEAAEQNGLRGVLHHTFDMFPNMKADQKAFRGIALTLGGIGAGLFFGIKRLIKKREKDKNGDKVGMSFLGKLALLAGVGLGTNMLTGKSPLALLDKAINGGFKFKDMKMDFIKFGKNASPDAQEAVVNPFNVNSLLGSKKLSDLPLIMDTKTFKFNNYNDLLKASSGEQKKILEDVGSEDKNNVLLNGLKQMGITPDNISELDQNKTVDDYYRQYLENIAIVTGYRAKNKLQVVTGKEDEEKKLITSGKPITEAYLNTLRDSGVYEALPGTVDSAEAVADKAALDMQVDGLTGIMVDKETLKKEVHTFYDKMPKDLTGKKKVSITQSEGKTYLETYDDKAEINIDKRTIMRYSDKTAQEFVFASINELLLASNLTNYIKKICKEKTAVSVDPFKISTPGGDIEFNDAKVFSFAFDTEIIRAGWGGTLKDISPTLENHKQEYCDYLNTTTPKFWKEAPIT